MSSRTLLSYHIQNQETKYWLNTLSVFGPREVSVPRADIMEKTFPKRRASVIIPPKKQQFIFGMATKYTFCEEGF